MSRSPHPRLTRRAFLKTSGAIAGMSAVATLLSSCNTTTSPNALLGRVAASASPVSVGVLLPRSVAHPAVAQNVLAGMRVYADHFAQRPLHLATQEVGVGQRDAYRGAQALLEQGQVDLLAGVINPALAPELQELLYERRTILAVADIGANVPRSLDAHPYVFANSLGYWQASYAMGGWAAQSLGRRAAVVSSFYDSGYDTLYAFRQGFEGTGGQIVETFVSHRPIDSGGHLSALIDQIKAAQPDFVYAISSGRDADAFLRAYAESGLAGRIPLAGSSLTLADQAAYVAGLPNMPMVLPWARNLGHAENQSFVAAYETATGRPADALALLGYETAQLIDSAITAAGGDVRDTAQLQRAMGQAAFTGPRGALTIDPRSNHLAGPLYLGIARQGSAGVRHEALEPIAAPTAYEPQIAALRSSTKSGWTNAYLCV